MAPSVPVEFAPQGDVVWVTLGTTVLEASRATASPLFAPCGGRGTCGGCAVRVVSGRLGEPDETEAAMLERAPADVRLACRAQVIEPVKVRPVGAREPARPGASTAEALSAVAAVDVGTTTVAVVVLDAGSGREIGRATVVNAQASFGADILSRVSAALSGEATRLREAAESSILRALAEAGADAGSIERVTIVGNSAMLALLTGADVGPLATAPFGVPTGLVVPSESRLRAAFAPGVAIQVIEPVGAFVGSDIVAGIARMAQGGANGASLLVDIGTNAEVALRVGGRLIVASAPAGPAFEAAGIASGGPAVPGAVTKVRVEDSGVTLSSIGDGAVRWLCGAGLISAVAELRRLGHIAADGALHPEGPLRERFSHDEAGVARVRLGSEDTPLFLTQLDVRAVQLAKAAVRVAIEMTLAAGGVRAAELSRLWIAGAFGLALDVRDVVEIGVVPESAAGVVGIPGNVALEGAVSFVRDASEAAEARDAAARAVVLDLPNDPAFTERLISALSLSAFDA